jgi:hypothetical protein
MATVIRRLMSVVYWGFPRNNRAARRIPFEGLHYQSQLVPVELYDNYENEFWRYAGLKCQRQNLPR